MPGRSNLNANCVDTEQIFDGCITNQKLAGSITYDKLTLLVLTTTQRKALVSPATGLMVYDTTLHQPTWYNGTAWTDATGSVLSGG